MTTASKGYKGLGMNGMIARWYAGNTARMMHEFTADARRVAALLASDAALLEVAPGPGYFVIELAKVHSARITALDVSPSFIEIARRNAQLAGVRAEFVLGSASRMPLEDNQFDFIFCRAAFKNFSEPAEALREMHRVLKPGGRALIVDLRSDASLDTIYADVAKMGLSWFSTLATRLAFRCMLLKRAYSKPGFEKLVAQTPLRLERIDESGMGMNIWLRKDA
jgi:ubiquinone/menaquinone biosynthesis C-methylase UbiE